MKPRAFAACCVVALGAGLVGGTACPRPEPPCPDRVHHRMPAATFVVERPELFDMAWGEIETGTADDPVLIRYEEAETAEVFVVTYGVRDTD